MSRNQRKWGGEAIRDAAARGDVSLPDGVSPERTRLAAIGADGTRAYFDDMQPDDALSTVCLMPDGTCKVGEAANAMLVGMVRGYKSGGDGARFAEWFLPAVAAFEEGADGEEG